MEKRHNTLDRWQRLRFGRRAASNPPEDKKVSNLDIELASKRSSDKLERLREITELLKGPRNNAPNSAASNETTSKNEIPPIPPPRKPRTSLHRNSGSIEKFIDTSASESGSPIMSTKFDHSTSEKNENDTTTIGQSLFHLPTPNKHSLIDTLRPNTSVSNLESILKTRDKEKQMTSLPEESSSHKEVEKVKEKEPTTPHRVSSETLRPLIHANAQNTGKGIPFRSASFSQVDYSSGKYIRSALGALKASLSKAKSPPLSFSCKKERSGSSSPEDSKLNECTDIWIPLKGPCDKRNDLNLDLIDATATANMILEEECEHSPTSNKSDTSITEKGKSWPLSTINAAQMTVDSPRGETVIQGVDNYFETANPCMIPIPVFECSHTEPIDSQLGDTVLEVEVENMSNDFPDKSLVVEPNEGDMPVFSEIQSRQMKLNGSVNNLINDEKEGEQSKRNSKIDETTDKLRQKAQSPTLDIDALPAIAVTPGSSVSGSSFEEMDNTSSQQPNRSDYSSDYGEVRKRYSNEDKSSNENRSDDSNQSTSTSGTNSPKGHHDEKRRIDKSKRRKGMYIQWATLDKHNKELNAVSWTVGDSSNDLSNVPEIDSNGQPIWPIGAYRNENLQIEGHEKIRKNNLNSLSSLEPTSPDSVFTRTHLDSTGKSPYVSCDETQPTSASCDVFTPDSDYGRQPVWPQTGTTETRRQSLTLQSSEEKDESHASSPPPSKPRNKIFVLRSDSISDNEMSDRTPPPRERTSQSPAPDHDLKRYSKRPLRGPYGQMLEAEMKKPAKQNYDGLLEELNRSER